MRYKNFACLILSHGRADNVKTYNTLRKHGYTGPIYIVIDNEDKSADEYIKTFGRDAVIVFDKRKTREQTDTIDNFHKNNVVLFARNASYQIAKDLGLDYFCQLDDDYSDFTFKFDSNKQFQGRRPVTDLDRVFDIHLDYFKSIPALSIAFAQEGDFIGGPNSTCGKKITSKRKVMNSFICSVDRPIKFLGRVNEDVNMYLQYGSIGEVLLTPMVVSLQQELTQQSKGGLTEIYLEYGTYVKSFYSVIVAPSAVTIQPMGPSHPRLHHRIDWNAAVPKILNPKHKKSSSANNDQL